MNEKNMTALVSAFARCYHFQNNKKWIYKDELASKILSEEEYNLISSSMAQGIQFFNKDFKGTNEEALRWIVNKNLSPSVLGRSSFCERMLESSIRLGIEQYVIYAAGYDTSAYKKKYSKLNIFEIDREEMIVDKINRLDKSNIDHYFVNYLKCDFTSSNWINNIINSSYNQNKRSFNSLLGISYYLTKEEFSSMIKEISSLMCEGSRIVFDYPTYVRGEEARINEELAKGAKEEMKAKYSYHEMEKLLQEHNILIYEHLNDQEMTDIYFKDYNLSNPNDMIIAPRGVSYLLGVKKK